MCQHHINKPIISQELNKILAPYNLCAEIYVKDAECGGGEPGNIKPHSHDNVETKFIGNLNNIPLVIPLNINKYFKIIDHGQTLDMQITKIENYNLYKRWFKT